MNHMLLDFLIERHKQRPTSYRFFFFQKKKIDISSCDLLVRTRDTRGNDNTWPV